MRSRVVLTALVFALVLVAAGCGGSDDEATADPTAAWASDLCSAVTTWKDALSDITSRFTDTSNFSQDALETAADDAQNATEQLVDDIRDLGRPETGSGEEIESSLDSLSTTLETEVSTIRGTVDELSGLTGIPSAITTISASLTAMGNAFTTTWQTIDNADVEDELQSAFDAAPECAGITS